MEDPLSQQFLSGAFHPQHSLSHLDADQTDLLQFDPQLTDSNLDHLQARHVDLFDPQPPQPRFHEIHSHPSHTNHPFQQEAQFGILTPHPQLPSQPIQHDTIGRLRNDDDLLRFQFPEQGGQKSEGHFGDMKMIPNPPNLEAWRQRLFDVGELITLSDDEFNTYFPHIDNVYSHRSTQRYKRKPFVSHYWDCRLKGRPPGTPKSDDPNKKKRRRQARERDLCDVKIKITEYFPGARILMGQDFGMTGLDMTDGTNFFAPGQPGGPSLAMGQQSQPYGVFPSGNNGLPPEHPGSNGDRYYTIQRVNGNGGNGKGDGVAGPHKHTLEESDRVKKNSIQRYFAKEGKVKRKSQKPDQKTYHKKATGLALVTVKKHSKDHELKLYGSCFCPFVQRVWIALEVKGINYQYIEVDPYKKPQSLLEVNPRGLVPALRHGDWGCAESTVLMEYLEDLNVGHPLFTISNAKSRADCRLWSDHINRNLIPIFYRYLQCQDQPTQITHATELSDSISKLVSAAHPTGPFFLGPSISFVDIQVAPWVLRMRRVLQPYRGWPAPEEGSRWKAWVDAIDANEHVKATTSDDDLYMDSYERYAENRPDTSELAKAINTGRGLP